MVTEFIKARNSWRVIGSSVRGAAHLSSGAPNQDAIHWLPEDGAGPPVILAVSDGHGSPKCIRSDIGSRLAVTATAKVLQDFLKSQDDQTNLSATKRMAEDRLPQTLVRAWKEEVNAHLQENPFTAEEGECLIVQEGPSARQTLEATPFLAYGATILAAVVTESFLLCLKLGDGDILLVDSSGGATIPLHRDERLIANETTSLCLPDAWKEVQIRLLPLMEDAPAMVLLSTDGYSNSYQSETDFLANGNDLLQMVRSKGLDQVSAELGSLLEDLSRRGSGDDITLGIIKRAEEVEADAAKRRIEALEAMGQSWKQLSLEQQETILGLSKRVEELDSANASLKRRVIFIEIGLIIFILATVLVVLGLWQWGLR
jgi:serine/threonine protein phosphatase PrpC